jgi:hypothetical protein
MICRAAVIALCAGAVLAPAAGAAPRLEVKPKAIVVGDELTFVGDGFRPDRRVRLLVGPPFSEGVTVGFTRTGSRGRFVQAVRLTDRRRAVGRWIALACQRDCRVKATAAFRIVRRG